MVIENSIQFRNQLNSIRAITDEDKKTYIPILCNDINYLIKMKTDTFFLVESELSKWFNFSKKVDPFLVALSIPCTVSREVSK
jgi:hypothetical protein